MNEEIISLFNTLEEKENIKVLYGCESGSRIWGTDSANSDFDVRFIYIHEQNWYLQLYEGRDIIETKPNKKIEMVGWDLRKTLKLLHKSNPSLLEWLYSPVVYKKNDPFFTNLKDLAMAAFSPAAVLTHYVKMAKRNYFSLQKDQLPTAKRYLNIIRPLLVSIWVTHYSCIRDYNVPFLTEQVVKDAEAKNQILSLISSKKDCQLTFTPKILDRYIEHMIPILEGKIAKQPKRKSDLTPELNDFFISMLGTHSRR